MDTSSQNNAWVESYLDALLSNGLSAEFTRKPCSQASDKVNADADVFAKYYVNQLLTFGEDALKQAWNKACSSRGVGLDKDARLEYLSWRTWFMVRNHARVQRDEQHRMAHDVPDDIALLSDSASEDEVSGIRSKGLLLAEPIATSLPVSRVHHVEPDDDSAPFSPTSTTRDGPGAAFEHRVDKLYIVLISLHGLVRGDNMELGRDPDTGGQVKYVVELAKTLARHPAVHRVELFTRLIADPAVSFEYALQEEMLVKGAGEHGGAYIIRLPAGPTNKYISKEELWPYIREFADHGIAHVKSMMHELAAVGEACEMYLIHGHYADAGEAAALMSHTLGYDMTMTGHSLGRNKLDHLLKSGTMSRAEIESTYKIARRIEAEERALDAAALTFTSTRQEVDQQWGLYDGYNVEMERALQCRRCAGRHVPKMRVIPPGLDFSSLKVELPEDPLALFDKIGNYSRKLSGTLSQTISNASSVMFLEDAPRALSPAMNDALRRTMTPPRDDMLRFGSPPTHSVLGFTISDADPPIWKEVQRFLRNPHKPVVLAMSRPDAKKNIATLVKAFGANPVLREVCNLVLIMGNRENIDGMASGSAKVLEGVLKLIDTFDLYGSVAYPKKHTQKDISDIYLLAHATRGVFTNIAYQEPFGLTLIEAAAHGVPIVATRHGGPKDIIATLKCGKLVEPTDADAVGKALLEIVTSPSDWDKYSRNAVSNIMSYSWPAHCIQYLDVVEAEKRRLRRPRASTFSGSWDAHSFKRVMQSPAAADDKAGGAAGDDAMESVFNMDDGNKENWNSMQLARRGSAPPDHLTAHSQSQSSLHSEYLPSVFAIPEVQDDNDIGKSPTSSLLSTSSPFHKTITPRSKSRIIFVTLDNITTAGAAALLLRQLRRTLAGDSVGFGVLSMLEFQQTLDALQRNGVEPASVDVLSCSSGAALWYGTSTGELLPDEAYEAHINVNWDKMTMMRTLQRMVAGPHSTTPGKAQQPLLRELLSMDDGRNFTSETGAFHIMLQLDRESVVDTVDNTTIVKRLQRQVRRNGMRMQLNLQVAPNRIARTLHTVLHATPLRASRALALRFAMHRLSKDISAACVVACVNSLEDSQGPSCIAGGLTTDLVDVVGGCQPVCLMPPIDGMPHLQGSNGSDVALLDNMKLAVGADVYQNRVRCTKDLQSLASVVQTICKVGASST